MPDDRISNDKRLNIQPTLADSWHCSTRLGKLSSCVRASKANSFVPFIDVRILNAFYDRMSSVLLVVSIKRTYMFYQNVIARNIQHLERLLLLMSLDVDLLTAKTLSIMHHDKLKPKTFSEEDILLTTQAVDTIFCPGPRKCVL